MDEKFILIKESETLKDNFNIEERTISKIYKFYESIINNYSENLISSLEKCESPIEQLLRLELENMNLTSTFLFNPYVDVVEIENQVQIKCNNNKYRVDFLIPVIYKNQDNKLFIIECDGYDFHQKTKKQVERDNKRTRDLQKAGYEIIRFSGTEIWNNVSKCAFEIKNIILSKCEYNK